MVETAIVLTARIGPSARPSLDRLCSEVSAALVAFTDEHWPIALDAFRRYGKGRHPAALNFGDCLTYATAALADEPLLCVGDDFPQTDRPIVRPA